MTDSIFTRLGPYRTRRRLGAAVAGGVGGLLVAAIVAVVCAWAGARPGVVPAVLLAVPLAGAAVGFLWPQRWPAVAAAVDTAAGLDDRLVAAVEFAALADPKPVHELQLRDAARVLATVPPKSAVSVRPPRGWPVAVVAYLAAAGLWLGGFGSPQARAEVPENVLAAARMLDDIADELEQDALAEGSEELRRMAEKLRATAEAMRQPGCDCGSALAKVSQLQEEALAKAADEAKAAAGLKKLGGAMQSAGPLREAGKALEQGKYGRAAKALAGVSGAKFDPKEARTAADELNKAADALDAEQLPKLSDPARKLAKGAAGDKEQLRRGAEELARQAQDQERRRRLNLLTARLHRLLDKCKQQMQTRNLLDQSGKEGEGKQSDAKAAAGAEVPSQEELRKKMEDPKFRAQVEALLKKFDPDGTGELDEGPGDGGGPPDPARPRSAASRDRLRKLEQRLEEALQREKVPVIYHDAVRNYFRRLAQMDAPVP